MLLSVQTQLHVRRNRPHRVVGPGPRVTAGQLVHERLVLGLVVRESENVHLNAGGLCQVGAGGGLGAAQTAAQDLLAASAASAAAVFHESGFAHGVGVLEVDVVVVVAGVVGVDDFGGFFMAS